jgi:acyl-CoA thioesterase-1
MDSSQKYAAQTQKKLICLVALYFCFVATLQGEVVILCLGDSLTAGYGLNPEQAYPQLLSQRFKADGQSVKMINAGLSGSTTASGEKRLKWHLKGKKKADVLLLALGANDGLRGLRLEKSKEHLSKLIALGKEQGMEVILAGMKIPPNYGLAYTKSFENMYLELATEHQITLIPFLLEGVAGERSLNLADGIHPNAKGQEILAKTVYPYLQSALKAVLK